FRKPKRPVRFSLHGALPHLPPPPMRQGPWRTAVPSVLGRERTTHFTRSYSPGGLPFSNLNFRDCVPFSSWSETVPEAREDWKETFPADTRSAPATSIS